MRLPRWCLLVVQQGVTPRLEHSTLWRLSGESVVCQDQSCPVHPSYSGAAVRALEQGLGVRGWAQTAHLELDGVVVEAVPVHDVQTLDQRASRRLVVVEQVAPEQDHVHLVLLRELKHLLERLEGIVAPPLVALPDPLQAARSVMPSRTCRQSQTLNGAGGIAWQQVLALCSKHNEIAGRCHRHNSSARIVSTGTPAGSRPVQVYSTVAGASVMVD